MLPTLHSKQLNTPLPYIRTCFKPDALRPLASCSPSRARQAFIAPSSTSVLTKRGRCCQFLPLWHMRCSILAVVQATAYTTPHAACSAECADVKYRCCAVSPQQHVHDLFVDVLGGLTVSQEHVSAYLFPSHSVKDPPTVPQAQTHHANNVKVTQAPGVLRASTLIVPLQTLHSCYSVFFTSSSTPPSAPLWQTKLTNAGTCCFSPTQACLSTCAQTPPPSPLDTYRRQKQRNCMF